MASSKRALKLDYFEIIRTISHLQLSTLKLSLSLLCSKNVVRSQKHIIPAHTAIAISNCTTIATTTTTR